MYSVLKSAYIYGSYVNAGNAIIPNDIPALSNESSVFERIPVLNIKVGGYTPPAQSELSDFAKKVLALNARTLEGAAEIARDFAPVPAQRLGDVVVDAFRTNNVAMSAYLWLNRAVADKYDPKFDIRKNNDLFDDLPVDLWSQFMQVNSRAGGEKLRADILAGMQAEKRLRMAGDAGMWAGLAGSLLDIDSVVIVLLAWYGLLRLRTRMSTYRARGVNILNHG